MHPMFAATTIAFDNIYIQYLKMANMEMIGYTSYM
jgi:hypothetical protein